MSRSTRCSRRAVGLVLLAFAGTSGVVGGLPAQAHEKGNDPALYGEPHAGWEAPARASGPLVPATGALLGVHPEDSHSSPMTAEYQEIIVTEERLERRLDINNSFYGAFDSIADDYEAGSDGKRGLSPLAYWDKEMGRIPLISWGCKGVTSAEIAAGKHDDVINETAAAFRDFGAEIFVRWCWEMDGSKRTSYVGEPEDFVDAWIRIWTMFQKEGASNVVWVWCTNANGFKNKNSKNHFAWDYYPGDAYVDWVSADGYNWGVSRRNDWGDGDDDRWRGIVEIFDEFMVWARSPLHKPAIPLHDAPNEAHEFPRKHEVKPIMIGEYAAQDDPRDGMEMRKAEWMRDTHNAVNGDKPRTAECPYCGVFSDIAAMVYFDINADEDHQNGDWRIISSTNSEEAYEQYASDEPWFNQIHTVGWAPAANRPDAPPPAPDPPANEAPSPDPPANEPPADEPPAQPPADPGVSRSGYWMLGSSGHVFPFGDAAHHGHPVEALATADEITAADVEPTPSGDGYWVVDSAGRVFAHGDARHLGEAEAGRLASGERVTSLSASPTGGGYWMFTSTGRVLPLGDAGFFGDMSAVDLNGPVLDSVPTPSGLGYYMVASDGGIFAFGDAVFYGSMGDRTLNAPVQSLVPDNDGAGYWLVASDGGVFAFDAPYRGSMGATPLNRPVSAMVAYGGGYLMVGEDGGIFNFSDRTFSGSLGADPPDDPIVAVAPLG